MAVIALLAWGWWWFAALGQLSDRLPPRLRVVDELVGQGSTGPKVMLVFDNQQIPDRRLAELIEFIAAAIPPGNWDIQPVQNDTTVWGVADDYYDLFRNGRDRSPLATDALVRELRRGNPGIVERIPAGSRVRLPPLPVRAKKNYTSAGLSEDFRVFNPRVNGYTWDPTAASLRMPLRRQPRRVADELTAERGAAATGIVLDVTDTLRAAVRRFSARGPLPGLLINAVPEEQRRGELRTTAQVEMLQAGAATCGEAMAGLRASPFFDAASKLLSTASPARRAAMRELAARKRLVVLDTQTRLDHGHGSKVYRVAAAVLKELQAGDIAEKIERFDLVPVDDEAKGKLKTALTNYLKTKPDVPQSQKNEAAKWLDRPADQIAKGMSGNTFEMPEVLLQAVLRDQFTVGVDGRGPEAQREIVWLNMSFRVRSSALSLVMDTFRKDEAISFIASGNDAGQGLEPGYVPQDGATQTPQFVVISSGSAVSVDGNTTAARIVGPPVSLVATGCGFTGFSEKGSSFASPYVAAAAWLRYLYDVSGGAPVKPASIIRDLIAASQPVPTFVGNIRSGGFFDAAHFLAGPSTGHIVPKKGAAEPLRDFTLTPTCIENGSPVQGITYQMARLSSQREAISAFYVAPDDKKNVLLWRRRVANSGETSVTPICLLRDLALATRTSGASRTYTLSTFTADVAFISGPTS